MEKDIHQDQGEMVENENTKIDPLHWEIARLVGGVPTEQT